MSRQYKNFVNQQNNYRNAINDPVTAVANAAAAGAASVINNTVNDLFNRGQIKAQTDAIGLQSRLQYLTNAQQQDIANRLLSAQTDDQRLQIIADAANESQASALNAVATIKSAQIAADAASKTANASTAMTYAIIIVGSSAALIGLVALIYYIKRKK